VNHVVKGDEVALRQLSQWQWAMAFIGPESAKRISLQKQPPVMGSIIVSSLSFYISYLAFEAALALAKLKLRFGVARSRHLRVR
jgi:hypothetical protein